MKRFIFLIGFLSILKLSTGQTYGNEWINYNQKYFKIRIGTTGIYHLDYTTLINAATEMKIDLGAVNPKKWQIFYLGKEVPIFVSGEADNQFNSYDYIEFYAKTNDGLMDQELYSDPSFQAQKTTSMITDSSCYYLTYLPNSSLSNGWHMQTYKNTNYSSYTPEAYFMSQSNLTFRDYYNSGKPFDVAGYDTYNPEYTLGEGFCGTSFGFGQPTGIQSKTEVINSKFISPNGPLPLLSFTVVGTSDNKNVVLNHHLTTGISTDNSSFTTIYDTLYSGYSIAKRVVSLPRNYFGTNVTYLKFQGEFLSGVSNQGHGVSEIDLKYPRLFDLDDNTTMEFNVNASVDPRHINWINYKSTRKKPVIYDLTNGYRIDGSVYSGTQMRFLLPPSPGGTTNCYLLDSLDIKTITVRQVEPAISYEVLDKDLIKFNSTQIINKNKLVLLTNERLVGPYTEQYLGLKSTATNTSPNALVTVQQLYNNFSYGIPHPIAIRRYIRFLTENGDTTLKYLFLVGRGYQTNIMRANGFQNANMVPSIGVPASDNMFASDINGSGIAPVVAIGRLTVDKGYELGAYTNKLLDMANSENGAWKKEVMHLAGGEDGSQTALIKNKLLGLASFVESEPFGGKVKTLAKSAAGVSDPYLTSKLIEQVDSGKQLVTFLGHGSSITTDIDMGDTSEYANYGRYPIFFFNGCSIGNPCTGPPSKNTKLSGENFLKASRKCAIGFIAQTGLTELGKVQEYMQQFYTLSFRNHYTGYYTIGDAVKDMLAAKNNSSDELGTIIGRITFLQGDPSVEWYQPQLPDYSINETSISTYPANFTAISDSFALVVTVENNGKYVPDSFNIKVERSYPNDFIKTIYNFKVQGVKNKTTYFLYIKSKDIASTGSNKFTVTVNDLRTTDEGTAYANNSAEYTALIPGNGIHLIYPKRFDIISDLNNDTVELVAQALNIFENNYQFYFDIDTAYTFDSPWKRSDSSTNIVGQIQKWKIKLLGTRDSIVYYWRAKINTGGIEGAYIDRSFVHIFNHEPGWSQSHFPQFYPSSKLNKIKLNKIRREFEYTTNSEYVYVNSAISPYPGYGIKKGGQGATSLNPGAPFGGIIAILFNKNTLEQFKLNGIFNPNAQIYDAATNTYGYLEDLRKFYNFSIGYPAGNAQFPIWVDSIPDSTYVAICNRGSFVRSNWTQEVIDGFAKLGCKLTENVFSNNTSYTMIGRKGAAPGWAVEDSGLWVLNNDLSYIEIQKELIGKYDKGSVKSELIGPSSEWKTLYHYTSTKDIKAGDDFYINVHGISNSGVDSICLNIVRDNEIDISSIDAKRFPNIYLEGLFTDLENFTPPQLQNWRVSAGDVPEGALNPNLSNTAWRDSLRQGEQFNYNIGFQNVSVLPFPANLKYQVKVFNIDTRDTVYDSTYFYPSNLDPGKFFTIGTNFATNKMSGRYAYLIKVNFDQFSKAEIPELSLVNNSAIRYFEVLDDKINPILDVTFDARHISNGEIVSANPMILISSKDENIYNWQIDSTGIKLWWKKPNSTQFERIDFDSLNVKFIPANSVNNLAKAEFSPKNLPDGVYTLKVQSNDANKNNAGSTEYQINFTVVNQKSATNFYPYPNPFTTAMRFVFTLTGNEVPDYINIKIMTIQGKVVKELNKDDLGNIHVGSNITDIVWDGTDQYGDRLSNGVYLYTVTIKSNGEDITQISSDNVSNDLNADKANNNLFKHHTGKIVLLR